MQNIEKINNANQLVTLLSQRNHREYKLQPLELHFLTDDIYVRLYLSDTDIPLIFAFSNAGETTTEKNLRNPNYTPWGYEFIKKSGYSVISFSCYKKNNWFRSKLTQELLEIFSQHIAPYKQKLGYGGSMGGYAVGAYCDLLKLDRCLLFNPISTLNKELAPFEARFINHANNYPWHNSYHDGALTVTPKIIIIDPLFRPDKQHAYRYKNAEIINYRGVGHGIPRHLLHVNALKDSFLCLVNNTLPSHEFYRKIRNGKRQYHHYFEFITSKNIRQLTPKRKQVIQHYHQAYLKTLSEQQIIQLTTKKKPPVIPKIQPEEINADDINYLRDLAIELEQTNIKISLDLMLIAQKLRPNGTFIKQKIALYRSQLKIN